MILLDKIEGGQNQNVNFILKKGGGLGINLNYSENSHCFLNRNSKDLEIQWISIIQKPNKV